MSEMTCPACGETLVEHAQGGARYRRCASCRGIFLEAADLGALVEAETDWHAHRSTDTARLPRITADMTAPPPTLRARSFLDSLFTT